MITHEFKKRVVKAINDNAGQFTSNSRQANALGISSSQLSRILNGKLDKVLSDQNWMNIAQRLEVKHIAEVPWKTVITPAFEFIYAQLEDCQNRSISALLVDDTDIGKSHTAKVYAKKHRNVAYIDCSQSKSKQRFVRAIAKEFGILSSGRFDDVYSELIYNINAMSRPLIILDEAGDLRAEAFLEIKALWNATERSCGWYMMGADGLKAKIERQRSRMTVGYAEVFRRFGSRFQRVTPDALELNKDFKREQFAMVARGNGLEEHLQKLYAKNGGSLERVRIEYEKHCRDGKQLELVPTE